MPNPTLFASTSLLALSCLAACGGAVSPAGGDGDADIDAPNIVDNGQGDTCDTAIDVGGGAIVEGTTIGYADDYQTCNVGGVFGADRAYLVHADVAKRFVARVTPGASDYSAVLHVKRDCAAMFVCLSESMAEVDGDGTVEASFDLGAGESAYVLVDGNGGSYTDQVNMAEFAYTLSIVGTTMPDGAGCGSAIDVSAGGAWGSTTIGAGDDLTGSGCGASRAGEDRVYTLSTAESVKFAISVDVMSGSGASGGADPLDLAIYIVSDCASQACVPESVDGTLGSPTRMMFTTQPGVRYYIVVDGAMPTGTNYILQVKPNPDFPDVTPAPGTAVRG